MNTPPESETVRLKISEIRERCRKLLEEQETSLELRLEDADEPGRGNDPYNRNG